MNTTPYPPCIHFSRVELPSMTQGRRYRARHAKKDIWWFASLAMSLIWLFGLSKALLAIRLLPAVAEDPAALWNVIGSGMALLLCTAALLLFHAKKPRN